MKIEIIGAGAVGLLVASFLAEKQASVKLITRTEQQAVQLKVNNLMRTNCDGTTSVFPIDAAASLSGDADIIVIAVKYGQLQDVFKQLQTVKPTTPILFLQNGLAHYDEALRLPFHQIAFCSVQFGAQKINEYHVAHKGIGPMKIAVAKGEKIFFSHLGAYSSERFLIVFEGDAEAMLLEKAWLNCFINPLTAILQVPNGQLIQRIDAFQLLKKLYNEMIMAFPQFAENFHFEQVVALCERTAENTSSMLADVLAGRETEIETIVGAIIKKAHIDNKQLPILQTLYLLVKALEESGERM
ncbi:ketopantoate reductase [Solibacillus sp. R5-41]|uniref:2-dehydropantoate 2-reductase n=1 Tax=Solibacillus sp. R5-41 TaxID=2048654 RepID=UPI000C1284D5|nr:2-dehydropantoate 2-reductase [Solibacillus sp. R5-41]ATP39245.1 ketopantoate reductase [Solibacillus sp. R5-41]